MNPSNYIIATPKARTVVNRKTKDMLQKHGLELSPQSLAFTKSGTRPLLGTSIKVEKGEKKGWVTKILYLQPHNRSGVNVCPYATPACSRSCLADTGNLLYPTVRRAMLAKTLLWAYYPKYFLNQLVMEIFKFKLESDFAGKNAAIRLNGTSDIQWYRYINFDLLSKDTGIRFYDYTKRPLVNPSTLPSKNAYSITFSISEDHKSWERALDYIRHGHSAAVVVAMEGNNTYKGAKAAQEHIVAQGGYEFQGYWMKTIHGDEDDLRMLDTSGGLVVLHAKGKALKENSAFVHRISM